MDHIEGGVVHYAAMPNRHIELSSASTALIDARIEALENHAPKTLAEWLQGGPLCGCGYDGDGGTCDWDSVPALSDEALRRVA